MHCLKKVRNQEAKEFIRRCKGDTLLGLLFDLNEGRQLHKKRYSKEEALKAVDTSETAILNADDDFSIMSLYSILQENEREIKQEGTKLDLIILGIDENLFEKLSENV